MKLSSWQLGGHKIEIKIAQCLDSQFERGNFHWHFDYYSCFCNFCSEFFLSFAVHSNFFFCCALLHSELFDYVFENLLLFFLIVCLFVEFYVCSLLFEVCKIHKEPNNGKWLLHRLKKKNSKKLKYRIFFKMKFIHIAGINAVVECWSLAAVIRYIGLFW